MASGARLAACLLALALFVAASGQAVAQSGNPFAPVAYVNDRAITGFELDQRMKMLRLFRAPGDLQELALEQLIDDRLRLDAGDQLGILLDGDAVQAGLEEFAGRANMDGETFLSALAAEGVSAQSMRDFVRSGLVWRNVIQARFGPRAQVTDAEVDRALSLTSGRRGGAVVEIAEIYLPARNAAEAEQSEQLARDLQQSITTTAGFASAARTHSVAPTRESGGRTGRTTPINELPPALRSQILTLSPGDVSDPISAGDVIALFQLISLRETGFTEAEAVALEYAEYFIPGGRSEAALKEAAKVVGRVDTCDDLYGINKKQSPERLVRNTLPVAEVPRDVALELAKLDEGEISTALTRGGNLVVLMLCGRTASTEDAPDREAVRRQLINQRMGGYGDGYLAQLRADAIIRYP